MNLTKSQLKQIIKEELQNMFEVQSTMDRILSIDPGTPKMRSELNDLAAQAATSPEAQGTLERLKNQYAAEVATGEGTGKWRRMATAVFDGMTRKKRS